MLNLLLDIPRSTDDLSFIREPAWSDGVYMPYVENDDERTFSDTGKEPEPVHR